MHYSQRDVRERKPSLSTRMECEVGERGGVGGLGGTLNMDLSLGLYRYTFSVVALLLKLVGVMCTGHRSTQKVGRVTSGSKLTRGI